MGLCDLCQLVRHIEQEMWILRKSLKLLNELDGENKDERRWIIWIMSHMRKDSNEES